LGVETIRGDLRDRAVAIAACQGADCVFHVAGTAGIWGTWERYHQVNTLGTIHVLDGCVEHGVRRLIYTSSPSVTFDGTSQEGVDESAAYGGPTRGGNPVSSERPPQPDCASRNSKWLAHYPHSKALAEEAVLAANGTAGLATTALRPHLIWGPRDNHLIPRLLDRARSGRLRRVGDGTNLVDMIYVENAAAAHLAVADALTALDAPAAGKAYFISQSEPVNCWRWINQILALAGLPPIEKSISRGSASRIGAICERIWRLFRLRGEPPMTRFLAAQLGTSHWFDITAARRDFGYVPAISTDEGMRRLDEWLKSGPVCVSRSAK
jgi:nucleoside-diphosphate-sugar epimerase